jgi:hypothetical protein
MAASHEHEHDHDHADEPPTDDAPPADSERTQKSPEPSKIKLDGKGMFVRATPVDRAKPVAL